MYIQRFIQFSSRKWIFGNIKMGAEKWILLESKYMLYCNKKWPFENIKMGTKEWLSLG